MQKNEALEKVQGERDELEKTLMKQMKHWKKYWKTEII